MTDMSTGARRAVIYLFALTVLLAALNLFWTAHEVNVNSASQAAQNRATQAAQRRAGELVERKLCQTFGELAANMPPSGNPATNPSRGYEQRNHALLAQIGPDLGCSASRKAEER